jgi:hypothetical protein
MSQEVVQGLAELPDRARAGLTMAEVGDAMSTAARAGPTNHVAVTVLGVLTLLVGTAHAAFGGLLIFAGTSWFAQPREDPWQEMAALFGIGPTLVIIAGLAFLPACILGLLAGLGIMLRKQWGLVLAFILAGLAILLGLLWVGGSDQDFPEIGVGAAQLLYGIMAFVLITKGAEFWRPRL